MNRLILVGNGFDLAHNLKTSYCDFIRDYFSSCMNSFSENGVPVDDPLLEIKPKFSGYNFKGHFSATPQTALRDWDSLRQQSDYIQTSIKSHFLTDTLKNVDKINWVDLENDYFDHLMTLKYSKGFNFEKVKAFNIEFDYLRSKLENYLIRQQSDASQSYSQNIADIFSGPINGNELISNYRSHYPAQILILSFNYTNTLEKYKEICAQSIATEINYIHGQLGSAENPIIFGFGDEFNKDYLEFENLRNKELLKHIKSFGYFKTSNYHNLIRFIDADDFQVYVLGHSLGLSDRTMLKEIFEHSKCKSIKIYYHQINKQVNDYTAKTFDISTHFSDKGVMRKKIVPYSLSSPMPQL